MTDREFENYLALMSGLLKLTKSQREAIARELADHLDERLSALLERGVSREDAVTMALEEFGDVAQLASALTRSGRRQKRRWMMRLTMTSLAAAAALVFMAMALWPDRDVGPAPEHAVAQVDADRAVKPETANPIADIGSPVAEVVAGGKSRDDQLNEQTEAKLRTLIPAEFSKTPLNDVLTHLGKLLDVQTYIDRVALEDATVDPAVPVSITLKSVPADMLLDLILRQLQLTYIMRSGVIIVTTEEEAQATMVVRVYNVNDLLMPASDTATFLDKAALDELTRGAEVSPPGEPGEDVRPSAAVWLAFKQALTKRLKESDTHVSTYQKRADHLIKLITSSIQPDTWEGVGGDGSITFYRGAIVVSQTSEVHGQIAKLLPELRAATAKNPDIPFSPTDNSRKDQQP